MEILENLPGLWKHYLPSPKPEDNKYTRGHVLINGSGLDSTGATKLAAFAAARAGAGYTSVACDNESLGIYANAFTSIVAKPVKEPAIFMEYMKARHVAAVLLGPGNGRNKATENIVLSCLENKNLKLVLDADAISIFEKTPRALISRLTPNCILTPHEGEFKRVFEWFEPSQPLMDGGRVNSTLYSAKLSGAVIVLKGHKTVIASPDGRIAINSNAPASLATAGTGDVLAGIITSLFAQGMPAFEAACAGVWIHSECANKIGKILIAEDLINMIPFVIADI